MSGNGEGRFTLPKSTLLTKPAEYQAVYRKGKRIRGENFSLIYIPNGTETNRLGISIHGVKKAYKRNRIKRIIREFYRLHKQFISPPSDVVFAVRQGFRPSSPREVAQLILPLFKHDSSLSS